MRSIVSSTCLLVAFHFGQVAAQELPSPKPGEPHKLLAREAGTWDCELKMYFAGPDAPPVESKGVEKNKLVSGGLYLQTAFTAQMGERKFEGHGLSGYNPRTEEYEGTWVDNFSATPSYTKGTYDAPSKTMTVHTTVVDEAGNQHKQKHVTTWINDAKKKFEIFLLLEVGGKEVEVKMMEMTGVKRKQA